MPALPAADACAAQVFIEPKALMFLLGTEMDFVDDRLRSEFVFHNPNSKGECGECCPVASMNQSVLLRHILRSLTAPFAPNCWPAGCGESFNV